MLKLCKDCKHVIEKDAIYDYRCGHPRMQRINLVTGDKDPWFCSSLRQSTTITDMIKCSKHGELWERKPSEESQTLATDMPDGRDIVR